MDQQLIDAVNTIDPEAWELILDQWFVGMELRIKKVAANRVKVSRMSVEGESWHCNLSLGAAAMSRSILEVLDWGSVEAE
jgi:hypothetical protein